MKNQQPLPEAETTEKIIVAFTRKALPQARQLGATQRKELVKILRSELAAEGFQVYEPTRTNMYHRSRKIGQYQVDLVVDRRYAIVVKCMKGIPHKDIQRLEGALRQMRLPIGFVFNFGYSKKIIHRVDVDLSERRTTK